MGSNVLNYRALQARGAKITLVGGDNGTSMHLVFDIRGADGRMHRTGYAPSPHMFEDQRFSAETANLADPSKREFIEKSPASALSLRTLTALANTERARETAAGDANLSETAKRNASSNAAILGVTEMAASHAQLRAMALGLEKTRAELYATPAPDAASAVLDAELRGEYRRMDHNGRNEVLSQLGTPEMAAMRLALKRSTLPWNAQDAERINQAWDAHVAASQPEAVRAFQTERDNVEWGVGLATLLAKTTMESSGVDRFAAYQALKAVGNTEIASFTSTESAVFEMRIARAAAASAATAEA